MSYGQTLQTWPLILYPWAGSTQKKDNNIRRSLYMILMLPLLPLIPPGTLSGGRNYTCAARTIITDGFLLPGSSRILPCLQLLTHYRRVGVHPPLHADPQGRRDILLGNEFITRTFSKTPHKAQSLCRLLAAFRFHDKG